MSRICTRIKNALHWMFTHFQEAHNSLLQHPWVYWFMTWEFYELGYPWVVQLPIWHILRESLTLHDHLRRADTSYMAILVICGSQIGIFLVGHNQGSQKLQTCIRRMKTCVNWFTVRTVTQNNRYSTVLFQCMTYHGYWAHSVGP